MIKTSSDASQAKAITFSFRPAVAEDIEFLVKLDAANLSSAWKPSQFEQELNNPYSQILVLTDDETDEMRVGYVVFWTLPDEIHLLNIAVDLDWRGLGLGKKLMSVVINEAHRKILKQIFLEVRSGNQAARGLYQKLGFKELPIKKKYYSDGEDAVPMILSLR